MSVEPTAESIREAIRREQEQLARIVEFIRDGMRNGRISGESGKLLTDVAEHACARALHPLHRQLSDLLHRDRQS